jgi:enoyl-CoA hydratase/carnithine racemase
MTLRIDKSADHWTLTLNRADKLNALSAELVEALIDEFDQAAAANIPTVALRGEGRCFSAGFDMTNVALQTEGDLLLRFVRIETLLQRVAASPCMTVAFAHGRNFGAGVDLVAACKLRVAAPDATFRMPGLKFGLVLGTRRFAAIVGTQEARRLLETAATFQAEHALNIGFVERVSAPEQWREIMADTTARARALTPAARKQFYAALHGGHEDADLAALVRSASEPGIRQRIAAYLAS